MGRDRDGNGNGNGNGNGDLFFCGVCGRIISPSTLCVQCVSIDILLRVTTQGGRGAGLSTNTIFLKLSGGEIRRNIQNLSM